MKKNVCFCLLTLCLLSGCSGFAIRKKVVDNYYLIAPDEEEQLDLSYCDPSDQEGCSTIISETVFAVGHNQEYIIAKQHPRVFPKTSNKSITNYFILPINKKDRHGRDNFGLIGPLTFEQFNKRKKELNIPDNVKFIILKESLK
jgi:uncharacterized protein YceK